LRGVLGGIRSLVLDLDIPTRIGNAKCLVLHVFESLRYEPLMIHLAVSEVCDFTGAVPCIKWICKLPENKSVFHKVLLSPLDAFCLWGYLCFEVTRVGMRSFLAVERLISASRLQNHSLPTSSCIEKLLIARFSLSTCIKFLLLASNS